ncbi:MAG: hypothetical protein M3Z64_05470 [Verrucomicrobiota bacterium]|nr:hypothetical protein [Verrucomicrobiota bacterium]
MPEFDSDRWEEVINSIRGSCVWCKGVIYVCHLCELIVLRDEPEPVRFGVDQTSSYQKPSASESRSPSIVIEHRLLVESDNPGGGLNSKCALLACVLAHEMAHHTMFGRLRVNDGFRDFVDISDADRKGVLKALDAEWYAKLARFNLDVVGEHWAPPLEVVRRRIDGELSGKETPSRARQRDNEIATTAGVRIAGEWAAAVIGCMVAKRYATSAQRVGLIRDRVFRDFPTLKSLEINRLFEVACSSRDFEGDAETRAIHALSGAHRNPDIQSCSRKLKSAGLSWSAAPAALGRV